MFIFLPIVGILPSPPAQRVTVHHWAVARSFYEYGIISKTHNPKMKKDSC
jgi:hypothetical protein